jgi:hypothetical protein
MTGHTDGCLRAKDGQVFLIAEVKPNARGPKTRPDIKIDGKNNTNLT